MNEEWVVGELADNKGMLPVSFIDSNPDTLPPHKEEAPAKVGYHTFVLASQAHLMTLAVSTTLLIESSILASSAVILYTAQYPTTD